MGCTAFQPTLMHLLQSLLYTKCFLQRKSKLQKLFVRKLNTWLEGPGEAKGDWHGPSCNEKCAINTISFANAPLTSALGHSRRYSEKRFETLKRTLCANQKRTFLLWRRRMHRASYLKREMTPLWPNADISDFWQTCSFAESEENTC